MSSSLSKRHETVFLWEVRKANPNGEPSGNEPRIDRYTKKCDVTDVSIKRSVRNYLAHVSAENPYAILVTKLGDDTDDTVTLSERIEHFLFSNEMGSKEGEKLPVVIQVEKAIEASKLEPPKAYKNFITNPTIETLSALIKTPKSKKTDKEESGGESKKKDTASEKIQSAIRKTLRAYLSESFIDLRMFGSVLALTGKISELGGPITGPIQIEIGTSLHRVVHSNKQITSVMRSSEEKGGGIIGDNHCIEYGLFITTAIANENSAVITGLTDDEHTLFLKGLWRGMRDRRTHTKNQVPRLLIDIVYSQPFHFGDLITSLKLIPHKSQDRPMEDELFRSIEDFTVDYSILVNKLTARKEVIDTIRIADNGLIDIEQFKSCFDAEFQAKISCFYDIDHETSVS